jgi:hypothetical protein
MEPKAASSKTAVGSFCWLELATTEPKAATRFYGQLFGWTAEDAPMGPDFTYTMLKSGGQDVGGAYALMKEQLESHVPPHWMLYVRVESADEAAARAVELGGGQIVPPSDIPEVGRFAVLQDPTGAFISVFETGKHSGFTTFGDVGALCWADLNTPDPDKASAFYADWLGWGYEMGEDRYRHILNGTGDANMIGGIPGEIHAPPGTPAHWLPYFHAADCKATAARAVELGASAILPATLMPEVGTIGVIADPQGAVFALYQPLAGR